MSLLAGALGNAGSPNRSGSTPPGNSKPACGCATATPARWPSTTSTAGSRRQIRADDGRCRGRLPRAHPGRHITRDGLIVRRALDANPGTGQRRLTDRHFLFNSYQDADLGYAVTDHAAQSRTVTTGLVPLSAMVKACAAPLP